MIDRTDIVRIFIDAPEHSANYVYIRTKVTALARAYRDEPIPGTASRAPWAPDMKSRTLRDRPD